MLGSSLGHDAFAARQLGLEREEQVLLQRIPALGDSGSMAPAAVLRRPRGQIPASLFARATLGRFRRP